MRNPVILDAGRINPWTSCIRNHPAYHDPFGREEASNVSIVKSSRAASLCGVAWNVASTIVLGCDRRSNLDVIESVSTIDPRS
jgi:hypothetical protein